MSHICLKLNKQQCD